VTTMTCVICTLQFERKSNTTGKFCSRKCAWVGRGGAAFNARVAREGREKNGATQRDRGAGKGYRKLLDRHEHRVVAERILGRALLPGEIVRHRDGNARNNDPAIWRS